LQQLIGGGLHGKAQLHRISRRTPAAHGFANELLDVDDCLAFAHIKILAPDGRQRQRDLN